MFTLVIKLHRHLEQFHSQQQHLMLVRYRPQCFLKQRLEQKLAFKMQFHMFAAVVYPAVIVLVRLDILDLQVIP